MNQITRCPNCSTSFRVTNEQLAAHQGKVRCGRCSFIFNARDYLQQIEPVPASSTTDTGIAPEAPKNNAREAIPHEKVKNQAPSTVEVAPANLPNSTSSAVKVAIEPEFPVDEPVDTQAPAVSAKNERDLQRALARLFKNTQRKKSRKSRKPNRNTIATSEAEIEREIEISSAKQAALANDAEYQPILDDTDDLFLPPKRSAWHWLWGLGSLILTISLLAQLAYHFRLELSQEFPAMRPKWQAICLQLRCEMPLPRQADLLRSEWSELTYIPDHPSLIQVKATLRNLAPYEQALPKLELTLTDESERVVAKKIFSPNEYLAQSEIKQSSLRSNEELHAFLQLDLGALNSTGYSLYWFYD